jgi:hypothetical protein
MAMEALPPAEARVIRMPAHTHETVNTKENGVMPYKPAQKPAQKQYPNALRALNPTIYLSIRPHIRLLLPLHPHPCFPSPVSASSSCFVLDWWRSLLMLDVFFHDLSVSRGFGVPPTQRLHPLCLEFHNVLSEVISENKSVFPKRFASL